MSYYVMYMTAVVIVNYTHPALYGLRFSGTSKFYVAIKPYTFMIFTEFMVCNNYKLFASYSKNSTLYLLRMYVRSDQSKLHLI